MAITLDQIISAYSTSVDKELEGADKHIAQLMSLRDNDVTPSMVAPQRASQSALGALGAALQSGAVTSSGPVEGFLTRQNQIGEQNARLQALAERENVRQEGFRELRAQNVGLRIAEALGERARIEAKRDATFANLLQAERGRDQEFKDEIALMRERAKIQRDLTDSADQFDNEYFNNTPQGQWITDVLASLASQQDTNGTPVTYDQGLALLHQTRARLLTSGVSQEKQNAVINDMFNSLESIREMEAFRLRPEPETRRARPESPSFDLGELESVQRAFEQAQIDPDTGLPSGLTEFVPGDEERAIERRNVLINANILQQLGGASKKR